MHLGINKVFIQNFAEQNNLYVRPSNWNITNLKRPFSSWGMDVINGYVIPQFLFKLIFVPCTCEVRKHTIMKDLVWSGESKSTRHHMFHHWRW